MPQQIIELFNKEPVIVSMGVDYLKIIAFSQIFMCLEICAAGSFNGMGKTVTPSVVGIALNVVRVFIIFWFFKYTDYGVNVAWWSISLTSILKGIILVIILIYFFKKFKNFVY
ncbi:MAG: hypothetical protein IPO21_17120 [Bacteroidales bacterium]|nr:hypothetical protein [Bacteroidales bacterium]